MNATENLDTEMVPFHKIARRLPGRKCKHLNPAALDRWHRKGLVPSGGGERVRLEADRMGGHWCTSWEKLQRFFESLRGSVPSAARIPTKSEGEREIREANEDGRRRLERLGFGKRRRAGACTN